MPRSLGSPCPHTNNSATTSLLITCPNYLRVYHVSPIQQSTVTPILKLSYLFSLLSPSHLDTLHAPLTDLISICFSLGTEYVYFPIAATIILNTFLFIQQHKDGLNPIHWHQNLLQCQIIYPRHPRPSCTSTSQYFSCCGISVRSLSYFQILYCFLYLIPPQ